MNYKVFLFFFAYFFVFSNPVQNQWVDINNTPVDLNSLMSGKQSINVLVTRATDCISCVKTMLNDKLLKNGKKIVIVGFLYEEELEHISSINKKGIIILRDYKFNFIRKNRIKYTPVIITLNKGLHITNFKKFGE